MTAAESAGTALLEAVFDRRDFESLGGYAGTVRSGH